MKVLSTFAFFLISLTILSAQGKSIFVNAVEIDAARYKDFKGSPYLFDDWVIGDIYDDKEKSFEKMELNFNGYTNEVEVKKGNKYITLDQKWYFKIEVSHKKESLVFFRGIHDFFKNKFVEVLYQGKDLILVKKFRVGVTEKEINDVGKTIKIKRFEKKEDYYFIKKGKLTNVKFKKKSILSYLGHKKQIESYAKKNKLKVNRPKDLKKILAYYEEQGF